MKQPQSNPDGRTLLSLGLARRAGQLITGTDMVCDALAAGKVRLVVRAGDVSENTKKKLTDKCGFYGVPLLGLCAGGEALARAVGKAGTLAAVGVTGEIANSVLAAWERAHQSTETADTTAHGTE